MNGQLITSNEGCEEIEMHSKFLDTDDSSEGKNKKRTKLYSCLWNNALILSSTVGVIVGFGLGFGLRPYGPSVDAIMWIGKHT